MFERLSNVREEPTAETDLSVSLALISPPSTTVDSQQAIGSTHHHSLCPLRPCSSLLSPFSIKCSCPLNHCSASFCWLSRRTAAWLISIHIIINSNNHNLYYWNADPGSLLLLSPAVSSAESSANVISSKYCASGVGDGCDDLSEGNAFIKQLQETSAKNKDRYAKVYT